MTREGLRAKLSGFKGQSITGEREKVENDIDRKEGI